MTDPGQPAPDCITADGARLAYVRHRGEGPGVMFLGGFASDMGGTKAMALDAWAQASGRAFVRFDYFAHGASDGGWDQGDITRWRSDALAVLDQLTEGPQVLVGSSMGGWIALLAALVRPDRVKALVLIAPAADFTETLMWDQLPFHAREAIGREGQWTRPSPYGGTQTITRRLIEDGRRWLVLDQTIALTCPVQILHGWQDRDVPWSHSMRLMGQLASAPVTLTMTRSGDHRLSGPDDLARLIASVEAMSA
ncbi:MAG: alpha/beta hydrolase [Oceanicaulis sp.]|nr:alpha/beta hydrolase [Oceanicaulis sp.]